MSEPPRGVGRPPGASTAGGLARFGYSNAFLLVMIFGTIYLLLTQNVFVTWLRALLVTTIIMGVVYVVLLGTRKRLTGSSEIVFVVSGFLIFAYVQQPNVQQYIPFQVTPLDIVGSTGQTIMANSALVVLLVLLAGFVAWKAGIFNRHGVFR